MVVQFLLLRLSQGNSALKGNLSVVAAAEAVADSAAANQAAADSTRGIN
jgi:hypothetical protein